jgi:periplasmic protein TonB
MNAIFRHRDGFASGPALLMLLVLQLAVARPSHVPSPPAQEPIEIVLMAPPAEPPPLLRPPEPKPVVQPAARPRPAIATPTTVQAGEVNLPAPAPKPTAEVPLSDQPLAPPTPPAPQPPRVNPVAELEAAYVTRVRQMLNAIKRYPTGREASLLRPSGSVRVWLLLDRNGQLLDRGVETSSQSLLLDNAALKTVSVGSYPPFPAELWAGQAQRRFHADIDFVVPNG